MKNRLLCWVIPLLLLSCKEKRNDSAITHFVVSEAVSKLEDHVSVVQEAVEKTGNNPFDIKVLEASKKLEALRNSFIQNRTTSNLLAYSDTIYKQYRQGFSSEKVIAKQIAENRKSVLKSSDSLSLNSLFFWTLKAEQSLQAILISKVIPDSPFGLKIPLFLDRKKILLGDTVFAGFSGSERINNNWNFNFNNLKVLEVNSQSQIKPRIKRIGPIFLLEIIPTRKGEYVVTGKIHVHIEKNEINGLPYKDYAFDLPLDARFTVN